MPDVLRSYGMTCRSPDGSVEWIVCEQVSSPFLAPDGMSLRFNSEQETELALSALGYERDGAEDRFGFRRWRRMARA